MTKAIHIINWTLMLKGEGPMQTDDGYGLKFMSNLNSKMEEFCRDILLNPPKEAIRGFKTVHLKAFV
jgi:hypothetical protein